MYEKAHCPKLTAVSPFPREGLQWHPFMKCNGIKDIAENPTEAFAEGTPK